MSKIVNTDDAAMELLNNSDRKFAYPATKFVTKPYWFATVTKDNQGNDILRNQLFLDAGWYASSSELAQAKKYAKEFPKLNAAKWAEFKKKHKVSEFKDPVNPLKAVVLDVLM
jgi:hypothetical protein